jgi:hypothetical protein
MKLHRMILFALLLLLSLPFAAHGQSDESEVVLFHGMNSEAFTTLGGSLEFVSLNDGSVQTVPLPPQLFPTGSQITDQAISPDHRYLAIASQDYANGTAHPIAILDLQSNSCCIYLQPPAERVAAYDLGSFSPDSGRFVFSWVSEADPATFPFTGGIVTVDTATGTPLQNVTMDTVSAALGLDFPAPWATLGDWREDGVRFIPNCYGCEPQFEGEWAIWTPETNAFSANSGEYFSFTFGDVLPGTGEMIYSGQSAQFPMSTEPAYLPIPNVVYYIVDAPMPTFSEPTNAPVIYFDPNQVDLSGYAHWVLDGEAVLITPYMADHWTLLYRGGAQQPLSIPPTSVFMTGTPNGWLAVTDDPNGNVLTMYTVEGAEVPGTPLGAPLAENEYFRVLDAPELGTTLTTTGGFPTVEPLFPPVSASGTCPNLLPSRVSVGSTARVTPGDPNRLRSDPTTSGAIMGEIPGGAEFYIFNGPICDDAAGIVWWQVGYNNLIGWTAESQGDTYFVEPIGVG